MIYSLDVEAKHIVLDHFTLVLSHIYGMVSLSHSHILPLLNERLI